MPSSPVSDQQLTVAQAGEQETLRRILQFLPSGDALLGPGDDSAVIAAPDGRVVITTDTMIEGPDFRLEWSSPRQLGRKAMASNIADVVAMGARPTGVVVALAVPKDTPVVLLEGIAKGCAQALEQLAPGTGVVGGDLTTSEAVTIAVTAFGSLDGRDPVTRSAAQPGDVLAVAGPLGHAAAGLRLLFAGVDPRHDGEPGELIGAQLAPEPPLYAGVAAAEAGVTAMMDLSDGLLLDSTRLADASNVTLEYETELLAQDVDALAPILENELRLTRAASCEISLALVLSGGEDHSLLATFPADATLPEPFRVVGRVLERGDASVLVDDKAADARGWDPYRDATIRPVRKRVA